VTHRYIPNTDEDARRMLDAIGVSSVDVLFEQVPAGVRLQRDLDIPPALSEPDLIAHLQALAGQDADPSRFAVFLGAGVYRHFSPSLVDQLLLRSEFYTAYTPYQPEISQGTLQAIFEFQTLVSQLMGTDLANASMYDGSTAMAEAAMMAARMTRRQHRAQGIVAGLDAFSGRRQVAPVKGLPAPIPHEQKHGVQVRSLNPRDGLFHRRAGLDLRGVHPDAPQFVVGRGGLDCRGEAHRKYFQGNGDELAHAARG